MKKLILIIAMMFCLVSVAGAWDEGGWGPPPVPYIKKTAAPTVADHNFGIPYLWVDETNDKLYLLIDNTPGAAVWQEVVYVGGSPSFVTVKATTFDTNVATAGLTLSGTTLGADGTDSNIDTILFPKGSGVVSVSGTTDYENNVTDDDDLPNRKYTYDLVTAQDLDTAGDSGTGVVNLDLQSLMIAGTTNRITTTALNQTVTITTPQDIHAGASPTFVTTKLSGLGDGFIPYHIDDATGFGDSPISTDGTDLDVHGALIKGVADAVDPTDAANLQTVLEQTGISLHYYLGDATLDQELTESEAAIQEEPNVDLDLLSLIFFVADEADTPAPFTVDAGIIVPIHFSAKVTTGGGSKYDIVLYVKLGYVDDDGSSTFIQIGVNSDSTAILTTDQTSYSVHVHVVDEVAVPLTKRLYLQVWAVSSGGGSGYDEINFYFDSASYHVQFAVGASVLENFVRKTGDAMSGTLGMVDNLIERAVLKDTGEAVNALGNVDTNTHDIDFTLGHVVTCTLTGNPTFTFSNPPTSGVAGAFTLHVTEDASPSITWPGSVHWPDGAAPSLTTSGIDTFVFWTIDAGTIWNGYIAGLDVKSP